MRGYLTEVKLLVDARRKQDDKRAALLKANVFALASNPQAPVAAPPAEPPTLATSSAAAAEPPTVTASASVEPRRNSANLG